MSFIVRTLLMVGIGIILCSCGLLAGRYETTVIQTEPSHGIVYDQNGDPQTAPLLQKVRRSSTQKVSYVKSSNEQNIKETHSRSCSLRWPSLALDVVAGGLVAISNPLLGGLLAGGLIGGDFLFKTSYDCPTAVKIRDPQVVKGELSCPKLAVIPPNVADPNLAKFLVQVWKQELIKRESCLEFVAFNQANEVFDLFGLGHREVKLKNISQRNRLELGHQLGATHLVDLGVLDAPTRWHLHPTTLNVIDGRVQNLKDSANVTGQIDLVKKGIYARNDFGTQTYKTVLSVLSLLPNSIYFAPVGLTNIADAKDNIYSAHMQSNESTIMLTSWSLFNVDHPRKYAPLDFTWRVSPSFSFKLLDYELSSKEKDGPEDKDLDVFFLSADGRVSGIAHTPAGALELYLGLGGAYFNTKVEGHKTEHKFALVLPVGLSYSAFLTDQLFARLDLTVYGLTNPVYKFDNDVGHHILSLYLGLGYYFPQLKRHIRKAI